jgi:anti-anti-sigma factor
MTQSTNPAMRGPHLVRLAGPDPGSGKAVVWLFGEHDLLSADSLSSSISLAAVHGTDVVVDLGGVEFMDLTTLSAILRAKASIEQQGLALTVRNPSRFARYVLCTCRLDHLIEPDLAMSASPAEAGRVVAPAAVAHIEGAVARLLARGE